MLPPEDPARRDAGASSTDALEALRARLDAIDELLLDCVRGRIHCCLEIGEVKRRHGIAMMQPHRISVVQRRAARYADANGIDGDFLHRLYDLIISETCRVESLVIGVAPER